jgi:hypothetical protein
MLQCYKVFQYSNDRKLIMMKPQFFTKNNAQLYHSSTGKEKAIRNQTYAPALDHANT